MTGQQPAPPVRGGASFIVGGGETGAIARAMDFTTSPLGPVESWPAALRASLSLALGSRFPIALYWGPSFVMLYNDALIPMVGANKHPQAWGRPAFEVLPEIRGLIEPLLQQVVETGEAIWSEDLMLPLFRNDAQEESYFTFTYSPIRDEVGVGGVFCAVIETSDKVIEDRRLRLLNALAGTVQDRSPAHACAAAAAEIARDPADIPFALCYLLDESAKVAHLAGLANLEADDALAPASIRLGDDSIWPLGAVLATGTAREVGFDPATHHGARGAVILPIERAGGGVPHGFIVAALSPLLRTASSYGRFHTLLAASVSQSVSNAAAYEAERARAESLARLDRAKTAFFSNISHEFRTPLTLMLAPIQDMLAGAGEVVPDRSTVELLDRNAQRLLKLVNTLLEFSRIEAGRVEARYQPVDLAAFTTELSSSFREVIARAGLTLVVDCPTLAEPIYVDRDMWERIVLNLLSNAFKFTAAGSITVRLRLDDSAAVLEVADTGTGVAAAELPRLFERFYRIEGAYSRSHEGSGIGLPLIQELARLHGGEVQARSELGVGTAFEVRIPRGSAHLDPARVSRLRPDATSDLPSQGAGSYVSEAMRWSTSDADADADADVDADVDADAAHVARERVAAGPRPRILVADDNPDMLEYVARLLRERWDVETVRDGNRALASIQARPPALVLSDVMMPGLDGFALLGALRADPALQAIPVILLSARAGEEETAKGLGHGANDYIAKPFSARELLVRVASRLASASAAQEMLEREVAQRAALYRHFMQAPFPICVLRGPNHVIELANPRMLATWGASDRVVGLPIREGVPELVSQPFPGYLDVVFATGIPHEGRAELCRLPTGPAGEAEDHYFDFINAPLRDREGVIEGVLVSAFEVTDLVLARRAAEASEQAQRAVLEFQERFVAILGHDLRNPLASITMGAGVIAQRTTDPAIVRVLGRTASSARRMSQMVEQILDLSRARIGGGIAVVLAPMDFNTMLADVLDEARSAHPQRKVELLGRAAAPGRWDGDRLEQVFSNLVGNALHHGLPSVPVTVNVHELGDALRIDVHNAGPAIPEAIREVIFEPFRQGERNPRGSGTAGLGLGLFISREIVRAHGGHIDVHSSAAQGTTFSVTLPRGAGATGETP